jgi:hypothetical protein
MFYQKRMPHRSLPILCMILLSGVLLSSCSFNVPVLQQKQTKTITDPTNQQIQSQTFSLQPIPENTTFQQAYDDTNDELTQFSSAVQLMQKDGIDTTTYQQQLSTDQTSLQAATSVTAINAVMTQINTQLTPEDFTTAQTLAKYLVQQFHQEVTSWGDNHQFKDSYNGQSYPLDFEYDSLPQYYTTYHYGEGSLLDMNLANAATVADYQNVISEAVNDQELLQAMEDDAQDTTPWNQPHATDTRLMQYYQTSGMVIVVSFYEQALRLYDNGKLIKSFQVVTGQYYRPTIVGYYQIESHSASTEFISFEDPSSPLYFPTTLIYWAMGFSNPADGYFLHSSPWRTYYGANKEFPHYDPIDQNTESRDGSHGCINLPLNDEEWLYNTVPNSTPLITY